MNVKRRVLTNAAMATGQAVIVGIALFVLFRFLLGTIGIEKVGIWSLVLAVTNVTRISELGFADSVFNLFLAILPRGNLNRRPRLLRLPSLRWQALGVSRCFCCTRSLLGG